MVLWCKVDPVKTVSMYEAKAKLSALVAEIEAGEDRVILCRHGVPVAELVPHRRGQGVVTTDPALAGAKFLADPCAPLSADDWPSHLR